MFSRRTIPTPKIKKIRLPYWYYPFWLLAHGVAYTALCRYGKVRLCQLWRLCGRGKKLRQHEKQWDKRPEEKSIHGFKNLLSLIQKSVA